MNVDTMNEKVKELREKPGVMFGRPDRPTSGRAIGYFAALRLETHRVEILKATNEAIGQKIRVDVCKNKYGTPFGRADIRLVYGYGLEAAV